MFRPVTLACFSLAAVACGPADPSVSPGAPDAGHSSEEWRGGTFFRGGTSVRDEEIQRAIHADRITVLTPQGDAGAERVRVIAGPCSWEVAPAAGGQVFAGGGCTLATPVRGIDRLTVTGGRVLRFATTGDAPTIDVTANYAYMTPDGFVAFEANYVVSR